MQVHQEHTQPPVPFVQLALAIADPLTFASSIAPDSTWAAVSRCFPKPSCFYERASAEIIQSSKFSP